MVLSNSLPGPVALLARIEHIAPGMFVAIASAVPNTIGPNAGRADVATRICASLQDAQAARDELVALLVERAAQCGNRVISVEVEEPRKG